MKTVRVVAGIGLALVLQSILSRWLAGSRLQVDLPLVAVVYAALSHGRVAGLLGGTLAGLAQDAVSGGVLGIGGMAKSVAGFLAGWAGTQFIVTQNWPRLLVFVGATCVHAILFMGVYVLLGVRQFDRPLLDVTLQAVSNGLVGVMVFQAVEFVPGARERWRVRRAYRQRTRFR